ncbi:MAG: endonuclease III [Ardenticatenaceae bacterium]|nr:endonuclease III [Ardenticatenaceae bacterium]
MSELLPPVTAPAGERLPFILQRLRQAHPDAHCALNYDNPLQLLVATILSAQCTDERVNQVTPVLFARYPDASALAAANRAALEEVVRSTGFYRQKARYIQETAHLLVTQHGEQVPDEMAALLMLPGVARKTANVVLGEIYGKAEGVVVDTHVKRLSQRLGLTTATTPEKIEQDLMALLPRSAWIEISHLLIFHGRRICAARRPDCAHCPLLALCPAGAANTTPPAP